MPRQTRIRHGRCNACGETGYMVHDHDTDSIGCNACGSPAITATGRTHGPSGPLGTNVRHMQVTHWDGSPCSCR